MRRFSALLFILLLFAGCAVQPTKAEIPTWMVQPVNNTTETLYGVGAGSSPDAAIIQALGAISFHLYISIKSSMKKSDHSIRFNGDETTRKEVLSIVKADTKTFDFTHFHVVESVLIDKEYVVLVSLDRKLLFTQQKMKLDTHISQIETTLATVEKKSSFDYFVQLHHAHKQRESLLSQMEILHAIDSTFFPQRYQDFINQIDQQYNTLKQDLHIQLISGAKAINFVTPIKNALNAEGIKVNNTLQQDYDVVTVLLSATSQQDEIYQHKIVKMRLNISVKNSKQGLTSATHTLHGKSSYSYDQARLQAADHLKNKIDSIGIFTVLGF